MVFRSPDKPFFTLFISKVLKNEMSRVFMGMQSSRKRRITRIGTHVFPLGHMFFARREFRVRMFFLVGMC